MTEFHEHNNEVLSRNATVLPTDSHIGKHLEDFSDALRFSKGEVFIEFKHSNSTVKKRVEGFVVKYEDEGAGSYEGMFKNISLWCTKNNELLTLKLSHLDECRVGDVDNKDLYEVGAVCYDCKFEFIDCHCGHY